MFIKLILLVSLLFQIYWLALAGSIQEKICYEEECINVEVVNTPKERAQGLMFRKQLGQNEGMLFVFKGEQKTYFWMKNMFIPLDIIWINHDKKIVGVKEHVQPCVQKECNVVVPPEKAKYVLEINAGRVKELGLKVGDSLDFFKSHNL